MATAVIPLLHILYTGCFWMSLGKVPGLVWFFFAPVGGMIAIYGASQPSTLAPAFEALKNMFWYKHVFELTCICEQLQQHGHKIEKRRRNICFSPHWSVSMHA